MIIHINIKHIYFGFIDLRVKGHDSLIYVVFDDVIVVHSHLYFFLKSISYLFLMSSPEICRSVQLFRLGSLDHIVGIE